MASGAVLVEAVVFDDLEPAARDLEKPVPEAGFVAFVAVVAVVEAELAAELQEVILEEAYRTC